jgi:hypothetical protein
MIAYIQVIFHMACNPNIDKHNANNYASKIDRHAIESEDKK